MAWMSDEKYELMQDTRDKKITARSARHTRTHCGKSGRVKFPSDYLSKKELKAMSGECKSYRMNDPISWKEFKTWPDEHKITYIKLLRKKYNVTDKALADMFGISQNCVTNNFKKLGLNSGKAASGSRRTWDKDAFYAWVNGVSLETPVEEPLCEIVNESATDELIAVNENADIEVKDNVEAPGKYACAEGTYNGLFAANPPVDIPKAVCDCTTVNYVVPDNGEMTFEGNVDDILRTIGTLLNGAKVHMVIKWDVVETLDEVDPSTRNDILKERIRAATYAIMNSERREKLGTKG